MIATPNAALNVPQKKQGSMQVVAILKIPLKCSPQPIS